MDDKRTILHVDLNSFFATAEQQANPYLRNKPVGVIKANGRTCVIAASVEAKRKGVKTGTGVNDAKKLCPGIILVEADFDKYADISFRFINICKSYSPICEVFSLDECFLDLTETEKLWGDLPSDAKGDQIAWFELWNSLSGKAGRGAINIAFEIKRRLREEIGDYMSCSVGISHNRLLAKLGSNQIKPDGLFWIRRENALSILDKGELTDVCGLGPGLFGHLKSLGISNFPQLRKKSLSFLQKHFGPFWSVHLYNISRGIDGSAVNSFLSLADAKSVGRTYTTHRNLKSKDEIEKLIRNLCEEAASKARQMRLAGRYVSLALRGGEEALWGHRTLKKYIDDGRELFDFCMAIAKGWKLPYVRFGGVTLGMLAPNRFLTTPLFDLDRKRQDLISAVDTINEQEGEYTVFPAKLLGMPLIRPEVNGYFGDRKYRLDFAKNR